MLHLYLYKLITVPQRWGTNLYIEGYRSMSIYIKNMDVKYIDVCVYIYIGVCVYIYRYVYIDVDMYM